MEQSGMAKVTHPRQTETIRRIRKFDTQVIQFGVYVPYPNASKTVLRVLGPDLHVGTVDTYTEALALAKRKLVEYPGPARIVPFGETVVTR